MITQFLFNWKRGINNVNMPMCAIWSTCAICNKINNNKTSVSSRCSSRGTAHIPSVIHRHEDMCSPYGGLHVTIYITIMCIFGSRCHEGKTSFWQHATEKQQHNNTEKETDRTRESEWANKSEKERKKEKERCFFIVKWLYADIQPTLIKRPKSKLETAATSSLSLYVLKKTADEAFCHVVLQ